jgi:hypothetical protein
VLVARQGQCISGSSLPFETAKKGEKISKTAKNEIIRIKER